MKTEIFMFGRLAADGRLREMRICGTNYLGTLSVTRAFVPILRDNGGGAIVNLLSLVALGAVRGMGGYSVSKAAAAAMTQAVRSQIVDLGVTVHGVFPGAVDTDMIRAMASI